MSRTIQTMHYLVTLTSEPLSYAHLKLHLSMQVQ